MWKSSKNASRLLLKCLLSKQSFSKPNFIKISRINFEIKIAQISNSNLASFEIWMKIHYQRTLYISDTVSLWVSTVTFAVAIISLWAKVVRVGPDRRRHLSISSRPSVPRQGLCIVADGKQEASFRRNNGHCGL